MLEKFHPVLGMQPVLPAPPPAPSSGSVFNLATGEAHAPSP